MNNELPLNLRRVGEEVSYHLDEIKKLFLPGVKVTLLVRRPSRPDGSQDFSMSDDDPTEAIRALERRRDEAARGEGITIEADEVKTDVF